MNHADAHNILDMRREGADMPEAVINRALDMTGDMPADLVQTAIEDMNAETAINRPSALRAACKVAGLARIRLASSQDDGGVRASGLRATSGAACGCDERGQ